MLYNGIMYGITLTLLAASWNHSSLSAPLASVRPAESAPIAPRPRPARVNIAGISLSKPAEPIGYVQNLMFTHGGQRVTLVADRLVSWDIRRPELSPRLGPILDGDNQLILSPDGRVGIETLPESGQFEGLRSFIDPATRRRVARFDPPETPSTVPMDVGRFSGDGTRCVAVRREWRRGQGPTDVGLSVWNVKTGKRIATLPLWSLNSDEDGIYSLAVSRDGQAVLVRMRMMLFGIDCVALWEPDTQRIRWSRPYVPDDHFSYSEFTADGTRIIVHNDEWGVPPARGKVDLLAGVRSLAGMNPWITLRMFDSATGRLTREIQGPRRSELQILHFDEIEIRIALWLQRQPRGVSPGGRTLAVASHDESIYLWDLENDRSRLRLAHTGRAWRLAFSPDGRTLAVADPEGGVKLYPLPQTLLDSEKP